MNSPTHSILICLLFALAVSPSLGINWSIIKEFKPALKCLKHLKAIPALMGEMKNLDPTAGCSQFPDAIQDGAKCITPIARRVVTKNPALIDCLSNIGIDPSEIKADYAKCDKSIAADAGCAFVDCLDVPKHVLSLVMSGKISDWMAKPTQLLSIIKCPALMG